MRRECRERFPRPPQVSDPDMQDGTCVTHVPWCMPGLLTSGFLWSWWRGKRSRHSRRMHNPQFHVSGKRPMVASVGGRQRSLRLIGLATISLVRDHLLHKTSNRWSFQRASSLPPKVGISLKKTLLQSNRISVDGHHDHHDYHCNHDDDITIQHH